MLINNHDGIALALTLYRFWCRPPPSVCDACIEIPPLLLLECALGTHFQKKGIFWSIQDIYSAALKKAAACKKLFIFSLSHKPAFLPGLQ